MPFETPETLTVWPFSNTSPTSSLAPTCELAGLAAELGAGRRSGGASAFLRCPSWPLVRRLLAGLAEADLDGVVAVAVVAADGGDPTGAGLDHGHALDAAVLGIEDLRHAQLASQQRSHQIS